MAEHENCQHHPISSQLC
jgi:hypothetical protein